MAVAHPASPAATDWRPAADAAIERHRRHNFTVRVTDPAGAPLPGRVIRLRLTRHAFGFGTAINHGPWSDAGRDGEAYRAFILRHFNTLVCENEMKWYATSPTGPAENYTQVDALLAWAEQHGLAMRGHCLLWGRNKFVPAWQQALPPAALRRAVFDHVATKARRYHGRVTCWDVNNEMLDGAFYAARLGPDTDAAVFREAAAHTPGTPLYVNEFALLGSAEKTDRMLALIDALRDRGAPVGGIGVQEHGAERLIVPTDRPDEPDTLPERARREGLTATAFHATLDQLATRGLPVHLTEISAKSADGRRRADALEMLYRLAFAHPAVEAILIWGFWAKCHWLGADAALVDADWQLTEAGERISHLLTQEWTTDVTAIADARGEVAFRGFAGDYACDIDGANSRLRLDRHQPSGQIRLP